MHLHGEVPEQTPRPPGGRAASELSFSTLRKHLPPECAWPAPLERGPHERQDRGADYRAHFVDPVPMLNVPVPLMVEEQLVDDASVSSTRFCLLSPEQVIDVPKIFID